MPQRTYFGYLVAQRGRDNAVHFFVFVAKAKDLAEWAGVRRVGQVERGTQRIIKESKIKALKKFFNVSTRNTTPTAIVIAFDPQIATFAPLGQEDLECLSTFDILNNIEDRLALGTLSFEFNDGADERTRPALIVDGQHRLKAISELENEDVPLLVISLLDASSEEQAFQFVVINNKADKVPTDNVKAIIATFNEQDLQNRLLNAGVSYGGISATLKEINDEPSSPFHQLLDWPLSEDSQRIIQLTTIEACLRYIRGQFPALESDEGTQKEIFLAIWRAVKSHYEELWIENEKFMGKVNTVALNEFITDRIAFAYEGDLLDIYDTDQVENQTASILRLLPKEFWQTEWKIKLQDNAVVKNAIKDDLKIISHNIKADNIWSDNTKLIEGLAS